MTLSRGILLAPLLLCACLSPRQLITRGEDLLRNKQFGDAQQAFQQALVNSKLDQSDRPRAQLGRARALLGLEQLGEAEKCLALLDEQNSGRWYYLGEIGLARGDLPQAEQNYRAALDRTHKGDTSYKLAQVMAWEAREPEVFSRAVAVLDRGGEGERARALRAALEVWRAIRAGADLSGLKARLPEADAVGEFPAVRLVFAQLLELLGDREAAGPYWQPGPAVPPASEQFRAHVSSTRLQLAIRTGDPEAMRQALANAAPAASARMRRTLAAQREARGDPWAARELLLQTVAAEGEGSNEALVSLARLERVLALPHADDTWRKVRALQGLSPASQVELALEQAARGDLPGAAARLQRVALPPSDSYQGQACLQVLTAHELLQEGLGALARGEQDVCSHLSTSLLLLRPGDPLGTRLQLAAADETPVAQAKKLAGVRHFLTTRLHLLLRAGELEAGLRLASQHPELSLAGSLTQLELVERPPLSISYRGGSWQILYPDGSTQSYTEDDSVESALGAPLTQVEWRVVTPGEVLPPQPPTDWGLAQEIE